MTLRFLSGLKAVLIVAVAALTAGWVRADDANRDVADEKAKSIAVAMQSSLGSLPRIYESVSKSIVRVQRTGTLNKTGVIVSPEGHILVGDGFGSDDVSIWGETEMTVHLSDGRTVTASPAGWSLEWRLAVMKIHGEGPWPAISLGSTENVEAGDPCLVIGYSTRGDKKYDSSPTARFGFVDRNSPAGWLTTTCLPDSFEAAAVVGIDGELLGVQTCFAGDQSYATAVDVFTANRDDLIAGRNLDWIRYPPGRNSVYRIGVGNRPELISMRKTDAVLGKQEPSTPMPDSRLAEVKRIAKNTTVRLISKDRLSFDGENFDRWSGVIVSEEGHIVTCAHTEHLPGERISVRLSDGRDADAIALGVNPITDIGLVKITKPGPWPYAAIGESSSLKPGNQVVRAGYPGIENGRWQTKRSPRIDSAIVRRRVNLLWFHVFDTNYLPAYGGMSGGGVFNDQGQYVGICMGQSHHRSEVVKLQWADLMKIDSIDTATGIHSPLKSRFKRPSQAVAHSIVELLVDSRPVGIGTIVDADGWVLTKASVLNGPTNCRLPNQSVVKAEKRAESSEHDLALLKIDAGGLPAVEFPRTTPPDIAESLCAVGPNHFLSPGIVAIETRAIPLEPRWKGDATEDTEGGVRITHSLNTNGGKLRHGDIILSINGHSTPDVASLASVLHTKLAGYRTGDLVSVTLRRKGTKIHARTALPPSVGGTSWMMGEHDSPRRSGFAAVFDTDIALGKHQVGCCVIDVQGHLRGIAIASRGRSETQRGPTSVLPSHIAQQVTEQLMADAVSQ